MAGRGTERLICTGIGIITGRHDHSNGLAVCAAAPGVRNGTGVCGGLVRRSDRVGYGVIAQTGPGPSVGKRPYTRRCCGQLGILSGAQRIIRRCHGQSRKLTNGNGHLACSGTTGCVGGGNTVSGSGVRRCNWRLDVGRAQGWVGCPNVCYAVSGSRCCRQLHRSWNADRAIRRHGQVERGVHLYMDGIAVGTTRCRVGCI